MLVAARWCLASYVMINNERTCFRCTNIHDSGLVLLNESNLSPSSWAEQLHVCTRGSLMTQGGPPFLSTRERQAAS